MFSLSFLDIMACGLGAVVLLFMIINHAAEQRSVDATQQLLAEAAELEKAAQAEQERLAELENDLEAVQQDLTSAQAQADAVAGKLQRQQAELAQLDQKTTARRRHVNALKADLKASEAALKRLEGSRAGQDRKGNATRRFVGEGDRQYLTGLKVGGQRILILMDASASMLDKSIVNIIRRRNLSDGEKLKAPKWRQAVNTVDWLSTRIPPASRFQLYVFNTQAAAVIANSDGQWLPATGGKRLDEAIGKLRRIAPQGGTSLHRAFAVIARLNPRPDNIYLLTDGLPTPGASRPSRRTVSAKRRLRHFWDAVEQLPNTVPINIILFPLEGDPRAVSAFWQLAQHTRGSLLSPSTDWP